ncbi:MAG: class I SAM-dependent methyltransferase [Steroidobacteraceae bacterium]
MAHAGQDHWDAVYDKKRADEVSWYEPRPEKSLELIRSTGIEVTDPIIDVGGGASHLVDELLAAGYGDLTVLDVSAAVLQKLRSRLESAAPSVMLLHQDVTAFRPARKYGLWHDRAVFHFLTQREEREGYIEALRQGVRPGGHVLMATFGPSGPERCSGLPTVRYDATTLAAELGADFALAESFLAVHRTPWNSEQQFLYCRFRALPVSPPPPSPSRCTS